MLPIIRHKGLINLFVVVGECVVGLGKWKMGKDIGSGYFLKILINTSQLNDFVCVI